MERIAVVGAGHVGPVIARMALDAGFEVAIANSGSPENLELITQVVTPGVEVRWTADAVAMADMVVLSIPLHRFPALDPALLAGKLVVDAMNYWAPADGVVSMFQNQPLTSSEIVARRLSESTVVKALNQIAYQDLEDGRQPAGSADRHAIGVAGDDPHAVDLVASVCAALVEAWWSAQRRRRSLTRTDKEASSPVVSLNLAYILGGLPFGIATFRAGILPRRAAGLLAIAAALTPATALVPHQIGRLAAVPTAIALAWLG